MAVGVMESDVSATAGLSPEFAVPCSPALETGPCHLFTVLAKPLFLI